MGCKTCGGRSGKISKDIPILDANNKVIASNYRKLKSNLEIRISSPQTKIKPVPNIKKNNYPAIQEITSTDRRINVLQHDLANKCIYIIGYMQGCGACNYMKRLINKIMTHELKSKIKIYSIDKTITEPKGFAFSGNPTILFIDHGKLVFQVGGIFNNVESKIISYAQS